MADEKIESHPIFTKFGTRGFLGLLIMHKWFSINGNCFKLKLLKNFNEIRIFFLFELAIVKFELRGKSPNKKFQPNKYRRKNPMPKKSKAQKVQ